MVIIDLLYTAACNSGHLDVNNVAKAFTVNNDIRQSVGWDSGIIYNYDKKQDEMGGAGFN